MEAAEFLLNTIMSYLISLAANERTDAIHRKREARLASELKDESSLQRALETTGPIPSLIARVCNNLARSKESFCESSRDVNLWRLLSDELFQKAVADWFMAGAIDEGQEAKKQLASIMENALLGTDRTDDQRDFLRNTYIELLESAIFSNETLAEWRHRQSLSFLRDQVAALRRYAEEKAGIYSPTRQQEALAQYRQKALSAWDIIDLSNLPEGDVHIATQKLLLRQLYMPLRLDIDNASTVAIHGAGFEQVENIRDLRRRWEAGRSFSGPWRPSGVRTSVGDCLQSNLRLVILGDPGGGKSTMLRWMATAYLLRQGDPEAFGRLPDTQSLPKHEWIPVLIRCRDLGQADLARSFAEFVEQHLRKTELLPDEAKVMCAVILERIAAGQVILLVDGLDEITDSSVRVMFCQELERVAARYPNAPVVATSRIVGYRDMPYRMGAPFVHGTIAELDAHDKDTFAERWIGLTDQHQTGAERARRTQELVEALHSSDRVERLTGNPMLLTTLALVKRKVGKLPSRRTRLYAEAVAVLLNWNPRFYQTIDEEEALPQLQYVAYEMCRRGVQRLSQEEILELLDAVRTEYPNIRAIRRREPRDFLAHLEARSSILIRSGSLWQGKSGAGAAIWEFRHLTFQEYLAARAIVEGRFPGPRKKQSIAEHVGSISRSTISAPTDIRVAFRLSLATDFSSWQEVLRLVVASCKDAEVDDVLLSILNGGLAVDESTQRNGAVLATSCLADEPNIDEDTAAKICSEFARKVTGQTGRGIVRTDLDAIALEIAASSWAPLLKSCLVRELHLRKDGNWLSVGGLVGMMESVDWNSREDGVANWFAVAIETLKTAGLEARVIAALGIMHHAYLQRDSMNAAPAEALFDCVSEDETLARSALWALWWLTGGRRPEREPSWLPTSEQAKALEVLLTDGYMDKPDTAIHLIGILRRGKKSQMNLFLEALAVSKDDALTAVLIAALSDYDSPEATAAVRPFLLSPTMQLQAQAVAAAERMRDGQALQSLLELMSAPSGHLHEAIARALIALGDSAATPPLVELLSHPSASIRHAVVSTLASLVDESIVATVLPLLRHPLSRTVCEAATVLHLRGDARGMAVLQRFAASPSAEERSAAVGGIARGLDEMRRTLLSRDIDGLHPWIDPFVAIDAERLRRCAARLRVPVEVVHANYLAISDVMRLKVEPLAV